MQYRMHRSICDFSSSEFYDGKLHTAVAEYARPLSCSLFPWPKKNRMVWVECPESEELYCQSKWNVGQGVICKSIIELLKTPPPSPKSTTAATVPGESPSIVILTPYNRQKDLLTSEIPNVEVCSIDSFQGREADIVVFVTVRCDVYHELGLLADMR